MLSPSGSVEAIVLRVVNCVFVLCVVFVNWVVSQTAAWHTWLALMEVIVVYIN